MKNLSSDLENNSKVKEIIISDRIKSFTPSKRRSMILSVSERNLNVYESMYLNDIIFFESDSILKLRSQKFGVKKGKSDKRTFKNGHCFSNSVKKMMEGYGYVEGYIEDKEGFRIPHSWNVDSEGNHFDFTLKNPEEYKYIGIVIPNDKVIEVGEKNGYIWYCVLPFVDNDFNYKEN